MKCSVKSICDAVNNFEKKYRRFKRVEVLMDNLTAIYYSCWVVCSPFDGGMHMRLNSADNVAGDVTIRAVEGDMEMDNPCLTLDFRGKTNED